VKITAVPESLLVDGEAQITLMDSNGRKHVLVLTARAEAELLTALLSAPRAEIGQTQLRGPIVARDLKLHESNDGLLCIEFGLTEKSAIHIALPRSLPEQLRGLLSEDRSKWRDSRLS
jgi:hypothetical protein